MKNHSNLLKHRKLIIVSTIAILFAIAFLFLFFHDGYPKRIINRFSGQLQEQFQPSHSDKAVDAWENCLQQLHINVDIAFLGDSITRRGPFADLFPDIEVCNLGLGSDTLLGMTERVSMVQSVSPDKVFILGGINSLRNNTLDQSIAEYGSLLSAISNRCSADVYVISTLPISANKSESLNCSSQTIVAFNEAICNYADQYGYSFVDLYSIFVSSDGFIRPELTTDGVHLTDEAYLLWRDEIMKYVYVDL